MVIGGRASGGQGGRLTGYAVAEMTRATGEEAALVAALKDGDEAAFAELVDRHTPSMLRVARGYVRSHAPPRKWCRRRGSRC